MSEADIPSPDEARDWLKMSGAQPDLSVTWRVGDAPGSAGRHLKLLAMLFEPNMSARGGTLPPHE